uniref:Uncharacterized protein n=1 Tax=Anguilla anguilla TaxID=7936 RepID=A0A0E9U4V6_ANGAN
MHAGIVSSTPPNPSPTDKL